MIAAKTFFASVGLAAVLLAFSVASSPGATHRTVAGAPFASSTYPPISVYFAGYDIKYGFHYLYAFDAQTQSVANIYSTDYGSSGFNGFLAVGTNLVFFYDSSVGLREYELGNVRPVTQFPVFADLMAADPYDNVFVASGNTISVYAARATSPSYNIAYGSRVTAMVVGHRGYLYATDGEIVREYLPGSSTPSRTFSKGITHPTVLALDRTGRLLVYDAADSSVVIYSVRGTTPIRVIPTVTQVTRIVIGPTYTLYVASFAHHRIYEYDNERPPQSRSIRITNSPAFEYADAADNLWVMNQAQRPDLLVFPSRKTVASGRWVVTYEAYDEAFAAGARW